MHIAPLKKEIEKQNKTKTKKKPKYSCPVLVRI